MGFRVQIWSGGALWNPLSFLIKDSIQSNLWTGKESSLLKIQLVKNNKWYKCRILGGSKYINAIGGMKLYDFEEFRENGLELAFLKADDIIYPQFGEEFVPNLSIIDVMMFNSVPEIQDMLNRYTLVKALAS